jgi:predicted AlkP superfamily phosphohydrolase/phosphomutase
MTPDLDEGARDATWHERAAGVLLERIERKTRFALEALRRLGEQGRAPDLACVVFAESDTVAHHFWRDHDPASPRHDARASAVRRGAVTAIYERLDAACGELRAAFGEEALCLVVSDHGSGGASRRVAHLNLYLSQSGLLRRRGAPRALGLDRLARHARDLALRALPPRAAEAAFRRARGAAAALESAARFGGIDWAATSAFSEEANTQPGVWINLRGREAEGSVAPGDYERVRDEVIAALRDWKLPGDAPVVGRARRREEVYAGPCVERAPDVVVELALDAGYALSLVPSPWGRTNAESVTTLADHELAGGRGRGMNGVHRPEGVAVAAGAGFERVGELGAARLADLAPTILRAMGVPWDERLDGVALSRAHYTPEEEDRVAARLRSLGYLE